MISSIVEHALLYISEADMSLQPCLSYYLLATGTRPCCSLVLRLTSGLRKVPGREGDETFIHLAWKRCRFGSSGVCIGQCGDSQKKWNLRIQPKLKPVKRRKRSALNPDSQPKPLSPEPYNVAPRGLTQVASFDVEGPGLAASSRTTMLHLLPFVGVEQRLGFPQENMCAPCPTVDSYIKSTDIAAGSPEPSLHSRFLVTALVPKCVDASKDVGRVGVCVDRRNNGIPDALTELHAQPKHLATFASEVGANTWKLAGLGCC